MKKLALLMIVKNEENKLERCIDSVKDLVDEMIIVDTGSTDKTKRIALNSGAKVFDYEWSNDFAAARNFSINQSSSKWNLVLDADEYILSNRQLIREFIEKDRDIIGRINIISRFLDDGVVKEESAFVSRLFPHKSIYFSGKVHEQLDSSLPRIDIPVSVLHDGYYETDKTDRNLPLLFEEIKVNKDDPYILYQIGKQYYLQKKYKDANRYFSLSYSKADSNDYFYPKLIIDRLYSLIRSGELLGGIGLIEQESSEMNNLADFHFVCGIFYMELVFSDVNKYINYFPLIERAYLRCLEIGERQQRSGVRGTGSYLALYNLGTIYETTGDKRKAIEYYQKSAEFDFMPARKRLNSLMK